MEIFFKFSFLIPKSYIIYEFTCSDNFFNEINLSIKNEGRIISRNNILIKVSNPQTKLYYNSKPFRGGMTVLTFPGETRNDVINFGESKLINETIKIENIISCSSNFNCRTTASGKSEDECEYFCEKGICQRLK